MRAGIPPAINDADIGQLTRCAATQDLLDSVCGTDKRNMLDLYRSPPQTLHRRLDRHRQASIGALGLNPSRSEHAQRIRSLSRG